MLLEAHNLSGGYGRGHVIHGANLAVTEGRIVGLIGPNGSGKSTLLRILAGQLRREGTLKWLGRDTWGRRELARVVGFVPQFPACEHGQNVAEVLKVGRVAHLGAFGFESIADLEAVEAVSQMLDLQTLLERSIEELSGGQRQRVFLGRGLVSEPKILLLDEPTSALDLKYQAELVRLLRRLAIEKHLGIVVACHDLNLAGVLADELVLLNDGRVAATGSPAEVLRPQMLESVYGVKVENRSGIGVVV